MCVEEEDDNTTAILRDAEAAGATLLRVGAASHPFLVPTLTTHLVANHLEQRPCQRVMEVGSLPRLLSFLSFSHGNKLPTAAC